MDTRPPAQPPAASRASSSGCALLPAGRQRGHREGAPLGLGNERAAGNPGCFPYPLACWRDRGSMCLGPALAVPADEQCGHAGPKKPQREEAKPKAGCTLLVSPGGSPPSLLNPKSVIQRDCVSKDEGEATPQGITWKLPGSGAALGLWPPLICPFLSLPLTFLLCLGPHTRLYFPWNVSMLW